jgi:hypothetical protein
MIVGSWSTVLSISGARIPARRSLSARTMLARARQQPVGTDSRILPGVAGDLPE